VNCLLMVNNEVSFSVDIKTEGRTPQLE